MMKMLTTRTLRPSTQHLWGREAMNRKFVVALSTKALLVALMTAAVMIPSPGHAKGCIKGAVSADLPATLCIMA